MLPSSSWGKRKPRTRRLGWVCGDARGSMWARQEGLHHPHPHPHTVIRCPSSSSSSVSCSGKGLTGCPASLAAGVATTSLFLCLLLPAVCGCHGHWSLQIAGALLVGELRAWEDDPLTLWHPTGPSFCLRALLGLLLDSLSAIEPSPRRQESLSHPAESAPFGVSLYFLKNGSAKLMG